MARGLGALSNSIKRMAQTQTQTGQVLAETFSQIEKYKDTVNLMEFQNEAIEAQQALINSYDENNMDVEGFESMVNDQRELIVNSNLSLENKRKLSQNIEQKSFNLKRKIQDNIYQKQLAEQEALEKEQAAIKKEQLKRQKNTITNSLDSSRGINDLESTKSQLEEKAVSMLKSGEIGRLEFEQMLTTISDDYQKNKITFETELRSKAANVQDNKILNSLYSSLDMLSVNSKNDPEAFQIGLERLKNDILENENIDDFKRQEYVNKLVSRSLTYSKTITNNYIDGINNENEESSKALANSSLHSIEEFSKTGESIPDIYYDEYSRHLLNSGKNEEEVKLLIKKARVKEVENKSKFEIDSIVNNTNTKKNEEVNSSIEQLTTLRDQFKINDKDDPLVKAAKVRTNEQITKEIKSLEEKFKEEKNLQSEKYKGVIKNFNTVEDEIISGKIKPNGKRADEVFNYMDEMILNNPEGYSDEEISEIEKRREVLQKVRNFAILDEEEQEIVIKQAASGDVETYTKLKDFQDNMKQHKKEDSLQYTKDYKNTDIDDLEDKSFIKSISNEQWLSKRINQTRYYKTNLFTKDEISVAEKELKTLYKENPQEFSNVIDNVFPILEVIDEEGYKNTLPEQVSTYVDLKKQGFEPNKSMLTIEKDLYKEHKSYDKEIVEDGIDDYIIENYDYLPQSERNKMKEMLKYGISTHVEVKTSKGLEIDLKDDIEKILENETGKIIPPSVEIDKAGITLWGSDNENLIRPHKDDVGLEFVVDNLFYNEYSEDLLDGFLSKDIGFKSDDGRLVGVLNDNPIADYGKSITEMYRDGDVKLTNIKDPTSGRFVYALLQRDGGERYISDTQGNVLMFELPTKFMVTDQLKDGFEPKLKKYGHSLGELSAGSGLKYEKLN